MPKQCLTVGGDGQISDELALLAHERLMTKIRTTQPTARDSHVARKVRTIENSFPKSVKKAARDAFLMNAAEAIAIYRASKSTGPRLPRAAINLFTRIEKTATRWEAELSKWSVKLPELRQLRRAAERRAATHQRSRGQSSDPWRASLISDLHDAYVTARGGDPTVRGFQRVANSVLRAAGLPPVSKHDLSQVQAQRKPFEKYLAH